MGRMSRHMSLAPSLMMATQEEPPERTPLKEFLCSHVKTIVTVFMIFGTIAVIVLIVMVHKWRFEGNQAEEERACLDVAIVGAGLSGSFAAWRLRNRHLKIGVFELEDRVGGRMLTERLEGGGSVVNAELGAMYYIPQQHKLLNWSIHALKLTPTVLRPPNPDHIMYFLRGVHIPHRELTTTRVPYYLKDEERLEPEQLKSMYLNEAVTNESDVLLRPITAKTKEGSHLYKHGYWNILGRVASKEGYNFLYDTTPLRSLVSNENAAVLGSVRLPVKYKLMTVAEGMDSIPNAMIREFLNASTKHVPKLNARLSLSEERHELRLNRRLSCVHRKDKRFKLIFHGTTTKNGVTHDDWMTPLTEAICAKRIVLALPRKPLSEITWHPIQSAPKIQDDIDSVQDIPGLRIFFVYNESWWDGDEPPRQHIITDLPIRQAMYLGSQSASRGRVARGHTHARHKRHLERHLFLVASPDMQDTDYFVDLINKYEERIDKNCSEAKGIITDITKQLAKVYNVDEERIPPPEKVLLKNWATSTSGAAWHLWKKNMKFSEIGGRILRPSYKDNIFIIGSAFCGGQCQLWMEGALQTVHNLLNTYLYKR